MKLKVKTKEEIERIHEIKGFIISLIIMVVIFAAIFALIHIEKYAGEFIASLIKVG